MSTNIKIEYTNESGNNVNPKVFVFTKNEKPTFDALKHGVAWQVLSDIGRGSSSELTYTIDSQVQVMWSGNNKTRKLNATIGKKYDVIKDSTGIVLKESGHALSPKAIDVVNKVKVDGGISAQICKGGKVLLTEKAVAYDQKATFVLHPKLYWGIASEIKEGQSISAAVLDSTSFQEQELEGLTSAKVVLRGNAREGYDFLFE